MAGSIGGSGQRRALIVQRGDGLRQRVGLARDGGAFGGYLVATCDHGGDAFGRFARAGAPALDLRIGGGLPFAVARQGTVGQGLIGL